MPSEATSTMAGSASDCEESATPLGSSVARAYESPGLSVMVLVFIKTALSVLRFVCLLDLISL